MAAWFARGVFKAQRFIVYEYDLQGPLPPIEYERGVEVKQATREDLLRLRQSKPSLPVEFFYDEIYGLSTCFLTFVDGELAKIVWLSLPGEFNRHFDLRGGEAEVFQVYVLPEFRHLALGVKTASCELKWLKDRRYTRAYARLDGSRRAWRHRAENVGYRMIGTITHFAFFCPKFRRRDNVI